MKDREDLRHAVEIVENARFTVIEEGHYRLDAPDIKLCFEVSQLRTERHQLMGHLVVRCGIPGAKTFGNGTLSSEDMNFSSTRAREDKARHLIRRIKTNGEVDWLSLLDELSVKVLEAERRGSPPIDLRKIPLPEPDAMIQVKGLSLPKRHPAILFGDGGSAKSYIALYMLGEMALAGAKVALFDWELAGEDHRERLERLFGWQMPEIAYARCERPLVNEIDRLKRIVKDGGIQYAAFDSVAFACDGPPEAAEVAGRYFRSIRALGAIGSLHIAHVSKTDNADKKPFGSAFWHNGARATWNAKTAEPDLDSNIIHLGLFNRKTNLGSLRKPLAYELEFMPKATVVRSVPIDRVGDFVETLSIKQRMALELRGGAMTVEALAKQIGAKADTVRRTAQRNERQFLVFDGGVGLKDDR